MALQAYKLSEFQMLAAAVLSIWEDSSCQLQCVHR